MSAYRRGARTMLEQQNSRHDRTEQNRAVRDKNEERTRKTVLCYPYCYHGNLGIYHVELRAITMEQR